MNVATSGFTPAGYPKAVPLALTQKAKEHPLKINLITGASVGKELDGALARAGVVQKRFPYQTNADMRNLANSNQVEYFDLHLSHVAQQIRAGFYGSIDIAIVEACAITEEGHIIPTTSVGNTPTFVQEAKSVIIEINTSQPMELEGFHDIYIPQGPSYKNPINPIPIVHPADRIGTTYIEVDPEKVVAVVITDIKDSVNPRKDIDETSFQMANNLLDFFAHEIKKGRLPQNLLPLQSGVGNVANAVLNGLMDSPYENLVFYSEVIQDSVLNLIDEGKATFASGCSVTLTSDGLEHFLNNLSAYSGKIILRPIEITNNPEIIRRLGVIAMNTALEVDIYGHVNSTHIMGTKIMNGIGGSGDFTRNAYLSIFTTPSTVKKGSISSIVPMVSHVDHTEHDLHVIITEHGVADLRGLAPRQRAEVIIENCAHPDYRPLLKDYLKRAIKNNGQHEPHLLKEALSWHDNFVSHGTMLISDREILTTVK